MDVLYIVLAIIIGYLIGSINGAVIISRVFYRSDIRNFGSGNAGATNMLRTFGKRAAFFTFLIDLCKGIVAALLFGFIFKYLSHSLSFDLGAALGGGFAILGHNWPVYFKFKGGKGVLTSFAVMLVLCPVPTLCCLGVFLIVVLISRIVSLSSILAAVALPFAVYFLGNILGHSGGFSVIFFMSVPVSLLLIIRHHANIGRIIKGTESKIGHKKEG